MAIDMGFLSLNNSPIATPGTPAKENPISAEIGSITTSMSMPEMMAPLAPYFKPCLAVKTMIGVDAIKTKITNGGKLPSNIMTVVKTAINAVSIKLRVLKVFKIDTP